MKKNGQPVTVDQAGVGKDELLGGVHVDGHALTLCRGEHRVFQDSNGCGAGQAASGCRRSYKKRRYRFLQLGGLPNHRAAGAHERPRNARPPCCRTVEEVGVNDGKERVFDVLREPSTRESDAVPILKDSGVGQNPLPQVGRLLTARTMERSPDRVHAEV